MTILKISFISSFEINNAAVPDPKILFWISVPVAYNAAVNSNGIKTLLTNAASAFFINGKLFVTNGFKKLIDSSSSLVTVLVFPFNKIPLFSKDWSTFIMSFISLFVKVIPNL